MDRTEYLLTVSLAAQIVSAKYAAMSFYATAMPGLTNDEYQEFGEVAIKETMERAGNIAAPRFSDTNEPTP